MKNILITLLVFTLLSSCTFLDRKTPKQTIAEEQINLLGKLVTLAERQDLTNKKFILIDSVLQDQINIQWKHINSQRKLVDGLVDLTSLQTQRILKLEDEVRRLKYNY